MGWEKFVAIKQFTTGARAEARNRKTIEIIQDRTNGGLKESGDENDVRTWMSFEGGSNSSHYPFPSQEVLSLPFYSHLIL